MSEQPDNIPTKFNVTVPTEAAEGHYADFASVWHNAETFILDFTSMTRPPRLVTDDTGAQSRQVDCQTVTRVRLPASQVWEVMKALESQLSQWEKQRQSTQPPG